MEEVFIAVSLETKFKKGDRVVCIDDDFDERSIPFFQALPIKNNSYIVRDSFTQEGKKVILLEEIQSKKYLHPILQYEDLSFYFEPAFAAKRFEYENSYVPVIPNPIDWADEPQSSD